MTQAYTDLPCQYVDVALNAVSNDLSPRQTPAIFLPGILIFLYLFPFRHLITHHSTFFLVFAFVDPVSQTVKTVTDMHVKLMQQMLSLSLYLSFTLSAPTHVDKKRNPPTDTISSSPTCFPC